MLPTNRQTGKKKWRKHNLLDKGNKLIITLIIKEARNDQLIKSADQPNQFVFYAVMSS